MSKRRTFFLRVAVILCSTALASGYISYRTTGRILPGSSSDAALTQPNTQLPFEKPAPSEVIMPGSKFATIAPPESHAGGDPEFMSSSKSAIVAWPREFAGNNDDEQKPADPPAQQSSP